MIQIDTSKYFWQTEKIRIRKTTVDDWENFYSNYFDSEARFFLDSEIELPRDSENAKNFWSQYIEKASDKNRFAFTIETHEGDYVGGASLGGVDERNGTFGLGMIIDRNLRGRGYGTAAMRILLDYAFNERRLHKYNSFVIEGNIASETMLKKIGCVHEGVVRETIFHQGRYWNEVHYGITAEEFNAKWKNKI